MMHGKCLFLKIPLLTLVAVFSLIILSSIPALAQDNMDEVLSSFDNEDQTSEAKDRKDADEIMEGFDESANQQTEVSDDVLSGFDEDQDVSTVQEEKEGRYGLPKWCDLSGSIALEGAYNLISHRAPPDKIDLKGLSRFRTEIDLEADLELSRSWQAGISGKGHYDLAYVIRGRDNFSDEVLDENEMETELREIYLQGSPSTNLDLKVGRQIVPWGTSESLRVVDVINPLDLRELGMIDIEDLRLPVTMTKLDYYLNNRWNVTGIAIHEIRFNKEPPFGSDFYPAETRLPDEDIPGFSMENQELAVALTGRLTGWDLSFHGAWLYNDNWHLEESESASVSREHSRLAMFGATVQAVTGNWLFKTETAFLDGLQFSNISDEEKSRLDLLAGFEYSGFEETTITWELVNRHILDYDNRLGNPPDEVREDEIQTVLRITRDFLHDTLHLTILASTLDLFAQDGAFERIQMGYDWNDNISITLGAIFYQGGDKSLFEAIKDNDRIFVEFKYSF